MGYNLNSTCISSGGYSSTCITGSQNISIGYSSKGYIVDINRDLIEYIDFAFQVLGLEIKYEDFKNMTPEEKKAFLRDIKLNKIL